MSDDEEYEYDYGSDGGGDGYNYSDNDDDDRPDGDDELIEIENAFYEGDDLRNENPQKAIELFSKVVEMESNRGDDVKWRFKALQHLVTLYYKQGGYDSAVDCYRKMLLYISSVTRNECTDAINTILDAIATASGVSALSTMYEITLEALKSANNERLWFNTNQKLAKLYLDAGKLNEVESILTLLKKSCQTPTGEDDTSKATYLLEVYSIEIQLCSVTNNPVRMRQVYPKTLNLYAAVADPRIMGIIREEGGKMYMSEGNWDDAYNEFYEAFRAYQEAGNVRARDCLKYVVLASMLALTDINPFAAREAKAFSEDKEIIAMSELRNSLEHNDLNRFERTLKNRQNRIMDEPFLMTYIHPLRRRMREQVLLNLTKPYSKVTLSFLATELTMTVREVESLLVDMILDRQITGHIDQIQGYLELGSNKANVSTKKLQSLSKWADSLSGYSESLSNKIV